VTRELICRPTALGLALVAACTAAGIPASADRLPSKREPTWSVRRRKGR